MTNLDKLKKRTEEMLRYAIDSRELKCSGVGAQAAVASHLVWSYANEVDEFLHLAQQPKLEPNFWLVRYRSHSGIRHCKRVATLEGIHLLNKYGPIEAIEPQTRIQHPSMSDMEIAAVVTKSRMKAEQDTRNQCKRSLVDAVAKAYRDREKHAQMLKTLETLKQQMKDSGYE